MIRLEDSVEDDMAMRSIYLMIDPMTSIDRRCACR